MRSLRLFSVETYDKFWPDLKAELDRAENEIEEVASKLSPEEVMGRLAAEVRTNTQTLNDLRQEIRAERSLGVASPSFGPLFGVHGLSGSKEVTGYSYPTGEDEEISGLQKP